VLKNSHKTTRENKKISIGIFPQTNAYNKKINTLGASSSLGKLGKNSI
jgi:hypothetical protein